MDTDQSPTFGSLLKRHRRAAGLSQEQLAERAGLTAQAISTLERGFRRAPYRDTVRALAQALTLDSATAAVLDAAIARDRAAPASIPGPVRPALPVPPGPLVGREREAAEVEALLRRTSTEGPVRLLTLLGPGGVGKTRLALHVAHTVADRYADGAVFVALAPLRDPDLVVAAIAQVMRVTEDAGRSLPDAVRLHLREKHLLLLLDNFEHVASAAPLVADLLAACPGLCVLVTSRARLHLSGEHIYLVPPLRTPDPDRLPPLADLAEMPAVALLVQRARAAGADVALDAVTAPALATLCRRLDGLPLAIELAAPRLAVLSPEMLVRRLTPRLDLLTGGARDLPARQQTLRATLEWSYALLSPGEQALFRRLSIVAGGCTLEAAEAVGALASGDVADRLGALIDKSLVYRETAAEDEPRFGMLETIREYALERLEEGGEAEAETVRRRHATYYLDLAEEAASLLTGAQQALWLDRLDQEHDNLRAAWAWMRERAAVESGARLVRALSRFWDNRGYQSEGRRWIGDLLARRPHPQPDAPGDSGVDPAAVDGSAVLWARVYNTAGWLAHRQGDLEAATRWLDTSLALYRAHGPPSEIARALSDLGNALASQGHVARALALQEESVALARSLGDGHALAINLLNLATTRDEQDDCVRAAILYEESLVILRQLDDQQRIAMVLVNLGHVAARQGTHQRAAALCEEALALFQSMGDRQGMAYACSYLGDARAGQGDDGASKAWYRRGLILFRELEDSQNIARCLEGIAESLGREGRSADAVALCATSATLREKIGAPLLPVDLLTYERTMARARAALGDDAYAAAGAAGQGRALEQAIDVALGEVT